MSNPTREPFIDQVPFPDGKDDADQRQCILLELFFLWSFFSSSEDESEPDGKGDWETIATDFLADSATSFPIASTGNFAIEANTVAPVSIA